MAFNLLSLIPAAVSLFSGKSSSGSGGGGSGSVTSTPLMPEWQYGLGEDLSGWARQFLSMYNPGESYGGELTSKTPTALESSGLSELQKLLSGPATGDLFGAAKTQIMDTLSGKYADPATSPFINAYTKLAGQNLNDSINKARGQRGARGTYFTRAGIQEESQLTERTQNMLNALIGDFMNSERGRQFSAAGMAKDLEGYERDSSIKRIGASQDYGGLERMLESADYAAKYDAWLNQRQELQDVPGVAASVFGRNIPTATSVTSPTQSSGGTDVASWIKLAMQIPGLFQK